MSTRDYPRLDIETFGRQLILSGDLDPVYIALTKMEMPRDQLARWLLVYWLCYHGGVASYLSEWDDPRSFWLELKRVAWNNVKPPVGDRWPRAPERRHWRGDNAINSVAYLMSRYVDPVDMVEYCAWENDDLEGTPLSCQDVRDRVEEHVAFGPWISFKVADMVDRVWGSPVTFRLDDVMYDSPTEAALKLWKHKQGYPPEVQVKDVERAVTTVATYLLNTFHDLTAPPLHDRPVGLPEVETVLCKWGSHMNGHYPLDNDLIEIRKACEPWVSVCKTAGLFLQFFPHAGQVLVGAKEPVTA